MSTNAPNPIPIPTPNPNPSPNPNPNPNPNLNPSPSPSPSPSPTQVNTNAPAGGALPPEFLRAGGCFAPECTLERLVPGEGDAARLEVAHTR